MLERAKRKNLFLSVFLVFALLGFGAIGCTGTQKGAGAGAGIGAALGAGVSALVGFDPLAGAAIGAGLGGLGGALIGDLMDDKGNKLTEAEAREARLQALEMQGQYDPDIWALRTTRDANGNIKVVAYEKPQKVKKLELTN